MQSLWASIEKGVRLGRSDTPDELQKKLARDPDLFLVAEEDGQIIGTVIGGYDGRRGLLYHLAVAASFRGRGIGSRLMERDRSPVARERLHPLLFNGHQQIIMKVCDTTKITAGNTWNMWLPMPKTLPDIPYLEINDPAFFNPHCF